ncbi:MAG TPA: undecaprenyl-diphosphatase UppP [Candidatus Paceibacterota bacterium]
MDIFQAAVLGIVQGLTEFIPVSSSGHLVIVHQFFGRATTDLSVDAILQLATTLAVLVYFRRELWKIFVNFFRLLTGRNVEEEEKTLVWAIILGTLPAFFLGLLLEDKMETVFRATSLVAIALIVGSLLMYFAEKYKKENKKISLGSGFAIGLFQALSLIPGISRSGSTISGGLLMGLTRIDATLFSFLLSFPILVGSGFKKFIDLSIGGEIIQLGFPLLIAFIFSFIFGFLSIGFLIKFLKNHSLKIFIWYRLIIAAIIFFLL